MRNITPPSSNGGGGRRRAEARRLRPRSAVRRRARPAHRRPGWTIAQITGIANPSSALEGSPEIVLLHIGTNDLPDSLSGASDRLAQLVDQILTALPSSLLVVAQIMPLPWAESSVVTYNAAIPGVVQARAAKGKHIILVDMNTGFPSSNGFASDNIHPNDTVGYPWMGDKWYATIAPYLH